jgi:para-nitrobenzyl esterase
METSKLSAAIGFAAVLIFAGKGMAALAGPVKTEAGLLSGVEGRDPSVTAYKGVPYAAPPIGDLRFRAPQPPIAWQGIRKADQFGKNCPQSGNKDAISEDCLFLNLWTGAAAATERRPVFVWIYGGGFSGGSGSSPEFDGEALAKKGLVVVTFNYRLGALGFLATPELSQESGHNASGNFGLLDDIAVLQWVHKNIAAFGGDPSRVTVAGQSAGAGSVGFLAMSPLAKGLIQRAIAESHTRYSRDTELRYLAVSWRPLKGAEAAGVKWAEQHNAHSLKELRALPWDQLIGSPNDDSVETGSNNKPPLFRPVVDGWVVPMNYADTYAKHAQNDVAFLSGNNRDETGAQVQPNVKLDAFVNAVKQRFTALGDEFFKVYPASSDEEAALMRNESVRDNSRISTFLWASDWKPGTDKPVYTYFWTHRSQGGRGAASHTSEIIFVFNNLDMQKRPWTDDDRKIADTISSYWANFAANGNPNGAGLPMWPAFDAKSPTVMELGDNFAPMPVSTPARLDFWKRFFATQEAW